MSGSEMVEKVLEPLVSSRAWRLKTPDRIAPHHCAWAEPADEVYRVAATEECQVPLPHMLLKGLWGFPDVDMNANGLLRSFSLGLDGSCPGPVVIHV